MSSDESDEADTADDDDEPEVMIAENEERRLLSNTADAPIVLHVSACEPASSFVVLQNKSRLIGAERFA